MTAQAASRPPIKRRLVDRRERGRLDLALAVLVTRPLPCFSQAGVVVDEVGRGHELHVTGRRRGFGRRIVAHHSGRFQPSARP